MALRPPGMGGLQLLDLHDFPGQDTALVGVLDPFWRGGTVMRASPGCAPTRSIPRAWACARCAARTACAGPRGRPAAAAAAVGHTARLTLASARAAVGRLEQNHEFALESSFAGERQKLCGLAPQEFLKFLGQFPSQHHRAVRNNLAELG